MAQYSPWRHAESVGLAPLVDCVVLAAAVERVWSVMLVGLPGRRGPVELSVLVGQAVLAGRVCLVWLAEPEPVGKRLAMRGLLVPWSLQPILSGHSACQ